MDKRRKMVCALASMFYNVGRCTSEITHKEAVRLGNDALSRLEDIEVAYLEYVQLVTNKTGMSLDDHDKAMDPDMEITRVDVPRSNPSWPVPARSVQE
jgi:hypothetical protein